MAKFGNPLGKGNEVWITQTYHGAYNRAIDLYGKAYSPNLPCYAIADGKISYTSTGAGSYCVLDVAGTDFRVWYVHTHNWLKAGTVVKKGQKICEIAPKSKNGGYPEHLHLGLTPTSKNIMDYMDRNIPFRTKYSTIKASWFNSDGTLNWTKHKNLSYIDDPVLTLGTKLRFVEWMNIRDKAEGKIIGKAEKESVCEVIGQVYKGVDFNWYKCKWADFEGWIADTTRNATSQLNITNVDATSPPDKQDLQDEVDRLSVENNNLKTELENSQARIIELDDELQECIQKRDLYGLERNRYRSQYEDAVKELNELKSKKSILEKIGELVTQFFKGGEDNT